MLALLAGKNCVSPFKDLNWLGIDAILHEHIRDSDGPPSQYGRRRIPAYGSDARHCCLGSLHLNSALVDQMARVYGGQLVRRGFSRMATLDSA
ncbi:hypothetical protein EM868_00360 [Cupriavidus gilardii]|uniref:hypothetical protein n=1 Tax=Cupriavidus gilardii TaxID=82541 RepID=UPI001EE5950E|nr:hypothetical protein [Cupriavidus gilardii]MCG5260405.1 hypothetical protein [Cupriavidus gilardii]MDF9428255.1 hypothetical protein [Cupriavidus gilardii]